MNVTSSYSDKCAIKVEDTRLSWIVPHEDTPVQICVGDIVGVKRMGTGMGETSIIDVLEKGKIVSYYVYETYFDVIKKVNQASKH